MDSKALRNLRFLKQRHGLTGFDSDYFGKLNEDELAWMERFARRYYDGHADQPEEHRREANHRRYMAKRADAQCGARSLGKRSLDYALDPETILIAFEDLQKK